MPKPAGPALEELDWRWRDIRYSPELHHHGSFGEYDVRASLPGVSVPVLVITGREDRTFAERPNEYFGAIGRWLARP